jgi:hypothetical protein
MSERFLEVARSPDGHFLASFDDGRTTVEVRSWDDIRDLRGRRHLVDHWAAPGDRQAFIELYGHPFDDWWEGLTAACSEALRANPHASVPYEHHEEVKRTLRHQPKQAGLALEGSSLSAELKAFVLAKAEPRP